MSKSRKIVVSSSDRGPEHHPISPTGFPLVPFEIPQTFNFTVQMDRQAKNFRSIRLEDIVVPRTMYNIINEFNGQWQFTIEEPGLPPTEKDLDFSIPSGYYDGQGLVDEINAQMLAQGEPAITTFDTATGKITFRIGATDIFKFYNMFTREVAELLGFPTSRIGLRDPTHPTESKWRFPVGINDVFTSPNVSNLNYPPYVICNVDLGKGTLRNAVDKENAFSFVIDMTRAAYGDFVSNPVNARFSQTDTIDEQNLDTVRVRLRYPDEVADKEFTLQGAIMYLVFGVD